MCVCVCRIGLVVCVCVCVCVCRIGLVVCVCVCVCVFRIGSVVCFSMPVFFFSSFIHMSSAWIYVISHVHPSSLFKNLFYTVSFCPCMF